MMQQFMHNTEIVIDFRYIPPDWLVVIMEVEMLVVYVSAMEIKKKDLN